MIRFTLFLCLILLGTHPLRAEMTFQDYFTKSIDIMLLIDPSSGEIVATNKAAQDFYGYTKAQLQNKNIKDINQLSPQQVAAEITLAKSEKRDFFIFRHKIADGTVKTVEVHSHPITYQGQQVLLSKIKDISEKRAIESDLWHYQNRLEGMVQLQAQELTQQKIWIIVLLGCGLLATIGLVIALFKSNVELKKTTAALANERNSFANIIEGTRVGTWEWNVQTGAVKFNEKWAEIIGYSLQELEPINIETWMKYAHPEDLKKSEEALNKCFSKEVNHYEAICRMAHKDGHWVWVQDRGKVFEWTEDGKPLIMAGTHTNVTKQVLAEEKFRNLLEYAADGIHILDKKGNVIICNQAFADNLGYSLKEAHNLNVKDWDAVVPVGEITPIIQSLMQHPETFETQHRRKDGSIIEVQINAKAIYFNNNTYLYASQRDIRDLKELQRKLEEQVELSKAASRAKSSFLANMSHEIRTPMAGIKGILELLSSSKGLDDHQRDLLNDLNSSSDALLALLNDILDFSKIEAEKLEIIPYVTSLEETLQSVVNLFAPSATGKGLQLTFEAEGLKDVYVLIDGLRVRQIISNLVGNAVKFTETGLVTLKARLDNEQSPAQLHVNVEDTGIGLHPDQIETIFSPFSQVYDQRHFERKAGGTGLGLSISSKLISLMGGEISATSQLGKGSTFKITLPVTIASKPTYTHSHNDGVLSPLNILFAEDNAINQKVIGKILEKHGHHVKLANNGQEALDLFLKHDFDVILMDMQMPIMNGEQATAQIRALDHENANIPIIAFTADAVKEHREDYLGAGANDILLKPVKWEGLEKMLIKHTQH